MIDHLSGAPRRQLRAALTVSAVLCGMLLTGCGQLPSSASTADLPATGIALASVVAPAAPTPSSVGAPTLLPTGIRPPGTPVGSTESVSPSPSALPAVCTDRASFVSDVTVRDDSDVTVGTAFVKIWRLQNAGTCTWTPGYALSFVGGDLMAGADATIASPGPAGSQSEISVNLSAPASPGTYTGQWQMKNLLQKPFGNVISVVISVGSAAECKRSSRVEVTISGHAGPENVTIDYGDGIVYTDQNGDYAFTVPEGWSGTVRPSKAKVNPWTFSPEQRTYTSVMCDLRRENYKATPPPGV